MRPVSPSHWKADPNWGFNCAYSCMRANSSSLPCPRAHRAQSHPDGATYFSSLTPTLLALCDARPSVARSAFALAHAISGYDPGPASRRPECIVEKALGPDHSLSGSCSTQPSSAVPGRAPLRRGRVADKAHSRPSDEKRFRRIRSPRCRGSKLDQS